MKNAVTALIRGYKDVSHYDALIRRNCHIRNNVAAQLDAATTDYLLFHEGNIPLEHQRYINQQSGMVFTFVDLRQTSPMSGFDPSREQPNEVSAMAGFGSGYRHMCHFWFVDFFDYLSDYRYAVRIDEDCAVQGFPRVFEHMQAHQWVFAAGGTLEDHPLAVIGMTEFAHFYRTRQGQAPISMPETKSGPMTNLMAVDLAYFRADPNFQAYRAAVSASRMIYTHRWGDLPLWGEYLRMYVDPQRTEFEWKAIHYYHASHGQMVNEDNSRYSWLQTLRNVSLGCTAVCNSRFAGCVSNPSAALNGKPTGAFTFHTNNSPTPFWEVDLGAEHVLKAVRILNRGDTCQERARGLVVEVSSDRNRYTLIHTQNDAFGGLLDTNPMVLDFRDSKNKPIGRYMRLRLPKDEYLHLDTVDVFA